MKKVVAAIFMAWLFSVPLFSQSVAIQSLDSWAEYTYNVYQETGQWDQQKIDSVIFLYPMDTLHRGKEQLYRIIASYYHSKNKYNISFPYYLQIERGMRQRSDSVQWAIVLGRIGEEYRAFQELSRADSVLRMGLEIAEGTGDTLAIAYVSGRLGGTIFQQNRSDTSCLKHYRRCIAYYEALEDWEEVGSHLAELSTVLGFNNRAEESVKVLSKAAYDKMSTHTKARLSYATAMSFYGLGAFDSSLTHSQRAFSHAVDADVKLFSVRSAMLIQKCLDSLGQMTEAYEWSLLSRDLQREYLESVRGDDLRVVQLEHQRKNQDSENARLLKEQRRQEDEARKFKIFIAFALVMLFILGVTVVLLLQNRASLRMAQNSLIAVNNEIDEKNKELEKYVILRDRMISVISHDLRSPMASLINMLGVMKDPEMSIEEIREVLPMLEAQMKNSIDFADNLIVWVKSRLKGTEAFPIKVDLFKLSQDAVELARPVWMSSGVEILVTRESELRVLADVEMTKFIVRNLLNNAIKFSQEGSVVTIEMVLQNDRVIWSIQDQGRGMTEEQLTSLFTIGEGNDSGLSKGAGIGLYLSHYFATMMGGSLTAISRKEGVVGSRFILELPAHT